MRLLTLNLRNFRNMENTSVEFCPGLNVIWGDNAQGKTNFLEALYLLGNGKSFRRAPNDQLINHGENAASVAAGMLATGVHHRIELNLDQRGKGFTRNGKAIQGVDELVAVSRQILFSPEEVGIAKGAPAGRRNLLDRAIFLAQPHYLRRIQEYNRILKQRNRLLKESKSQREIDPWSESLIDAGAQIRWRRQQFTDDFRPYLKDAYSHLTGQKESANLVLPQHLASTEAARMDLAREISQQASRERRFGITLAGPHRDDPQFMVNELDLRSFGSQGQQRSFILAFKTALVLYLEERVQATPVLLLDDISSELDKRRRESFFTYLLERGGQVFVTTTDPETFERTDPQEARYFRMENGRIFPEQR